MSSVLVSSSRAHEVAAAVVDPEMPFLTLEDLGVLRGVEVGEDESDRWVRITITPTYTGCPALTAMRDDLVRRLSEAGFDPVDVVVNGVAFATELEFAAATDPYVGEAGDYAVTYSDASSFVGEVPPATAWTIVSGFGEDPNTMTAYPVTVEAIPDGQAVVSVWNATATGIGITVDGNAVVVPPGELAISKTVAGGSSVSVNVGETTVDIAPEADNYIDVFAVTDSDVS